MDATATWQILPNKKFLYSIFVSEIILATCILTLTPPKQIKVITRILLNKTLKGRVPMLGIHLVISKKPLIRQFI